MLPWPYLTAGKKNFWEKSMIIDRWDYRNAPSPLPILKSCKERWVVGEELDGWDKR
jgi:hypothetical protein